ncbi:DUF2786 domain-containing protein [Plantactinospora sp. KBS50]|uniref:DUF2786 domain-containing protein n=1 Tax=Plantactinospora sp. KBS50 TaxID=2024580 RepID=UPI000BAB0C16|nr:DUF2786 domain-containing protein [Plantactinospora sp. KBS50]ASW53086.1 hypothetical protein CIK06_01085 [Plantactinospora sp. KBS50]
MPDVILDKVRKLLAKAEDPGCTAQEAAAFMAKATDLIARYGVDRALLATREPGTDPIGDRVVELPPPYALDKAGLLAGVATALRCRSVRRRSGPGRFTMHLFGFTSDLDRAELLFTSLLVQAAHGLAGTPVPAGEHPAAFRRSWLAGFTAAVAHRLRQAEATAATTAAGSGAPSMALVLADRSGRVEQRLTEAYPHTVLAGARRLAGGGRGLGVVAGRRADLGDPRLDGPAGTVPGLTG